MITKESAMRMTNAELLYARKDLTEVIEAQNTLRYAPKLGQYEDELFTVASELRRRERGTPKRGRR